MSASQMRLMMVAAYAISCALGASIIALIRHVGPMSRTQMEHGIGGLTLYAIIGGILVIRFYKTKTPEELLRKGKCVHCGYDMRETPIQCPECGHVANYARIDRGESFK